MRPPNPRLSTMALVRASRLILLTPFLAPLASVACAGSPSAKYDARISSSVESLELEMGGLAKIPVVLVNRGSLAWKSYGANPVHLSYHLLKSDGTSLRYDNPRTLFPRPVSPAGRFEGEIHVDTLSLPRPGNYVVEIDVVHEQVTWFGHKGSQILRIPVIVNELSSDLEPITLAQLSDPARSAIRSNIPEFEQLWKLIAITLSATLRDIERNGKKFSACSLASARDRGCHSGVRSSL